MVGKTHPQRVGLLNCCLPHYATLLVGFTCLWYRWENTAHFPNGYTANVWARLPQPQWVAKMQDGALLWNTLLVDIYWPLCILQYMQLCNHRCCIKSTHLVAVHCPNVLGRASPTMFSLWIWSFGSDRFLIKRGICLSLCTSHCEWQLSFQLFRLRQTYCFTYTSRYAKGCCLMLLDAASSRVNHYFSWPKKRVQLWLCGHTRLPQDMDQASSLINPVVQLAHLEETLELLETAGETPIESNRILWNPLE